VDHDLVRAPHRGNHTVFLSGPPGAGKTELAVARLHHLLAAGVPAEQILILVPQRTLAEPYYQALHSPERSAGGLVDIATIGGLARRTIELFWPLVAAPAGFGHPSRRPRFLTLETAQYFMDRIAEPFMGAGAFEGITIPRARLVSQVIDNLNKAAAVGFAADQIASRLKSAWSGESARLRIYDQVQALALAFRQTCLAENLLDWSLQIEAFWHHLLPLPQLRRYLLSGYRHLIVDNTEEDIPATHDLLRTWLPLCESALVVHDWGGGYRVFLGADPEGGEHLAELCRERFELPDSRVASPHVQALGRELASGFRTTPPLAAVKALPSDANPRRALSYEVRRFHTQMLDWVVEEIARLVVDEGLAPGEIAVLAPFLSDALRFAVTERLDKFGIPVRTHRPSRELREEPAARCLLTLTRLAHPTWGRPPPAEDIAHAFSLAIADMDPVRARLLADIVYRAPGGQPTLSPFYQIMPEMQERISYLLGGRYEELRTWIQGYVDGQGSAGEGEALDHFLSRLFGEVLSQPGFGFHGDLDAGAVAANLIESIYKFRQAVPATSNAPAKEGDTSARATPDATGDELGPAAITLPTRQGDLGEEYVEMVERGVIAAQYVASWQVRPEDAVLLVPAYTFLMMNQVATVQFWLDAGSGAWFERIYQPLTHPYVLRRDWPQDQVWADEHELAAREEALSRLVHGLALRCRDAIYLAFSDLNERGYEQQGPLRQALQRVLRYAPALSELPRGH
jgi:hypothetical protein